MEVAAEAKAKAVASRSKLGIAFAKEPTSAAPRVKGMSAVGLAAAAASAAGTPLTPGAVLIGVDDIIFPAGADTPRKTVLASLKPRAIAIGAAARAWQVWSSASGDSKVEEPEELTLVLTFETAKVECPRMPALVPAIFTGASRLGISEGEQLCTDFGKRSFSASKFVSATAPSTFVGIAMHRALRNRMANGVLE